MSVVLVTGASRGFGRLIALRCAREGDTVYASMRDTSGGEALEKIAANAGLDLRVVELDVTDQASIDDAIRTIITEQGRLDAVVNNAGIGNVGAFEDAYVDEIERIFDTNFYGAMRVTRAALPYMRAQRGGVIVMISSLAGRVGVPGETGYVASKFALEGASEALAHEVERWGIRVAIVEPGYFRTGMASTVDPTRGYPSGSPYAPLMQYLFAEVTNNEANGEDPEIVAELVHHIIHSDDTTLRWLPGELAPLAIDAQRTLPEADFRNEVRIAWWSAGRDGPDVVEAAS
jgi:NAD(P)-dependent dehydrogenase (short-subunit alcohol dehydrogenase family)